MPLVKCTKDGKSGWKWGKNNTSCFTGPEGKKKAIKQGIVIEGGPEKFAAVANKEEINFAIGNDELSITERIILLENKKD